MTLLRLAPVLCLAAAILLSGGCALVDLVHPDPSVREVWRYLGDPLTDFESEAMQRYSHVVIDATGQPVVIHVGAPGEWRNPAEIFAHRWTGETWESLGSVSGGRVCAGNDYGVDPIMVSDPDGHPMVIWMSRDSRVTGSRSYPIAVRRWIDGQWEEMASVPPGGPMDARFGSEGRLHLLTSVRSEVDRELQVHRWNGEDWEELRTAEESALHQVGRSAHEHAALALSPNGDPLVVWRDRPESGPAHLRAAFWRDDDWEDLCVEEGTPAVTPPGFPDEVMGLRRGYPIFVWWGDDGVAPTVLINTGENYVPMITRAPEVEIDAEGERNRYRFQVVMTPEGSPVITFVLYSYFGGDVVCVEQWAGEQWTDVGRGSGEKGLAGGFYTSEAGYSDIAIDREGHLFVSFVQDGAVRVMTTRPE